MSSFFQAQFDYVYFLYGLSFIILFAICGSLKEDKGKISWLFLGLFGLAHGIKEWMDIFALNLGDSEYFLTFRTYLLVFSFLFLFEFVRVNFKYHYQKKIGLWIYVVLLALLFLGVPYGIKGLTAASRYFICFPASLISAFVIFTSYKTERQYSKKSILVLSISMAAYAFLSGIIVSKGDFLFSSVVNYEWFIKIFRFPIQFLRGACALISAISIWSYSQEFVKSRDKKSYGFLSFRIETWFIVAVLLIVLGGGWALTNYLGNRAHNLAVTDSENDFVGLKSNLDNQFKKVDQVAMALASVPAVIQSLELGSSEAIQEANAALDSFSSFFDVSICYLMNIKGVTIASSNRNQWGSFVGKYFGFRPYFREAILETQGNYFALGTASNTRGYYSAHSVRDAKGKIIGVAVVKKDITELEKSLRRERYTFFVDPHGIIFLSNHPEFIFKPLWPVDNKARKELSGSLQLGRNISYKSLFTTELLDKNTVKYAGEDFYVIRRPHTKQDWSLIILSPVKIISEYRFFGIMITLFFCVLIIAFFMTLRHKRIIEDAMFDLSRFPSENPNPVLRIDIEGNIIYKNPAVDQLLKNSNLAEKDIYRLLPADIKSLVFKAISTKEQFSGIEIEFADRIYSYTIIPVIRAGYVNLYSLDITESKKTLKLLEISENRYRDLIENLQEGVWVVDEQGFTTFVNSSMAKILGYEREEMTGKHIYTFMSEQSIEVYKTAMEQKRQGKKEELDIEFFCKDTKAINLSFFSSPIFNEKGEYSGAIAYVLDITGRIELRKKISDLERFNKIAVGRELRMIQLKERIKELEEILNIKPS